MSIILKALTFPYSSGKVLNKATAEHRVYVRDILYVYKLYAVYTPDGFGVVVVSYDVDNTKIGEVKLQVLKHQPSEVLVTKFAVEKDKTQHDVMTLFCVGLKVLVLSGLTFPSAIVNVSEQVDNSIMNSGSVSSHLLNCKLLLDPFLNRLDVTPEKLVVQGPVSAYKLSHKASNLQMVLFGDRHVALDESASCAEMPWYNWLEKIFEPSIPRGCCVDVFLESMFFFTPKVTFKAPLYFQGYLFGTTMNALKQRLERQHMYPVANSDMRLHGADTRFLPGLSERLIKWREDPYLNLIDLVNVFEAESLDTLKDFNSWKQWVETLRVEMRIHKQWADVDSNDHFAQSIRRQLQTDTDSVISHLIQEIENKVNIATIKLIIVSLHASLMDEYVVGRALRKWDDERQLKIEQNGRYIVMYLGDLHITHLVDVFQKLGFDISDQYIGVVPEFVFWHASLSNTTNYEQCNDYLPLMPFFDFKSSTATSKRKREDES